MLLVDDNRDAAEALSLLLEKVGCAVRVSHSGAEARRAARAERPDVALLDIGLPDMDGHRLARALREEPALAGVRLVAVTGFGDARTLRRAGEAGFDATLVKPVNPAELFRLLRDAGPRPGGPEPPATARAGRPAG